MFKQTEDKYRSIKMGFGDGSIYDFGCYLVSFTNGLNEKGYSFTPESMNDWLKAANAWVGPFRNYIDVANLHKYYPNVFVSFQQIDPWNDVPPTRELLKNDLVVVCRVDARGIGGSGTHFVLLVGEQDGVAVIHDPWTGRTEKITVRYGNLGNILGLRIFRVKPYVQNEPPAEDKDKTIRELREEIDRLNRDRDKMIQEAVDKKVEKAIEARDKQWQDAVDKKLKEKDEEKKKALDDQQIEFNEQKQISDTEWQAKLDKAKQDAVGGMGGVELIARGIGKILSGKP